jgi:hypothetical protein
MYWAAEEDHDKEVKLVKLFRKQKAMCEGAE